MDRRRFLKYAVVAGTVSITSVIGLDYLLPKGPSHVQPSVTKSALTSAISTLASSTQLYSLQGRVFFDYNGNGVRDGEEPAVQNAKVQIRNINAQVIVEQLTDSSGDYKLDIPAGDYELSVKPDTSKQGNPNFSYMCTSPSEIRPISDNYDLTVVGDDRFDVGLMEGPFTQPFRSSTDYYVACYYNWDSSSKETRNSSYLWWNGQSGDFRDLFMYNNAGIDMPMPAGTDVLAPAPGIVSSGPQHGPQGQLGVSLAYPDAGLGEFGTFFNHLSEILLPEGTTVARGDVVAKSGESGTWTPHLHFNNWLDFGDTAGFFDFYQPEFEITARTSGYWYPETTWNSVPLGTTPNSLTPIGKNLWTRLNKPMFYL